ncbi:nuclear transport factor 2 family protein [Nocardia salmonicida]|uniref:nuclear transport factor 2 family protein n=1 Tax=Nocardia salmonicida TaxID=53431 RepID=UPI00366E94BA
MGSRNIIESFIHATESDPALIDALLDEDVTWELKGEGLAYARVYQGKADVFTNYWGPLTQLIDALKTTRTVRSILVDEAASAGTVHYFETLALQSGELIPVDVVLIVRVLDDKIVSVVEIMDLRLVAPAIGATLV